MAGIKFNYYKNQVTEFVSDLSNNLLLKEQGISFGELLKEHPKLNMAFVGQYNAGKSSLIKALTGIDVPIGSGVTTEHVQKYDYKDIAIWDTPGIKAGKRQQHDETSFAAMDQSDLLIYVITSELFDDVVGAAFRDLCFSKGREKEILLVVNKSQSDGGAVEAKLSSIAQVLEPRIPEDFPIVFVDAESYLDALDEVDLEDKQELITLSNFHGFIEAIDSFTQEQGLLGIVTTPLSLIHTQLTSLLTKLSAEDPNQEILVELLYKKLRILRCSEKQLRDSCLVELGLLETEIFKIGDDIAQSIDENVSEDEFLQEQDRAKDKVTKKIQSTQKQIETDVDTALSDLESNLNELNLSPLAESFKATLDDHFKVTERFKESTNVNFESQEIGNAHKASVKSQTTLKSAEKGLGWLSKLAVNEAAKKGVRAASGSYLHKTVLEVGRFFGTKFKPHQAIKVADGLGKAAKVTAPLMAFLSVGVQINDDLQQEKRVKALLSARRNVRKNYREILVSVRGDFSNRLNELVEFCYKQEIDNVESAILDIQAASTINAKARDEVQILLARLTDLREELVCC